MLSTIPLRAAGAMGRKRTLASFADLLQRFAVRPDYLPCSTSRKSPSAQQGIAASSDGKLPRNLSGARNSRPRFQDFPCKSRPNRESAAGDEFAADCPHRQLLFAKIRGCSLNHCYHRGLRRGGFAPVRRNTPQSTSAFRVGFRVNSISSLRGFPGPWGRQWQLADWLTRQAH
jgi:hypothetical protein